MKLDGTLSPAEAARKEIDKLRKLASEANEEVTDESTEEQEEQGEEESSESEESTTPQDTKSEVPREETVDYWKHRFEVVQGQQRAESQTLRAEIADLKSKLTEVQLSTPAAPQGQSVSEILDNLEEEYGADFTKAIDARIRNIVSSEVNATLANVKSELNSVKQTQAQTEQQTFEQALSQVVPSWNKTNFDPAFISWLQNSTEAYSGLSYMTILQNAYDKRDLDRTARFFTEFENLKRTSTNKPTPSEQSAMVAPAKRGSNSNAVVENNSGKVYTFAEVQKFYKDLQDGKYRGKEEQARLKKQEYLKANSEGRIV